MNGLRMRIIVRMNRWANGRTIVRRIGRIYIRIIWRLRVRKYRILFGTFAFANKPVLFRAFSFANTALKKHLKTNPKN